MIIKHKFNYVYYFKDRYLGSGRARRNGNTNVVLAPVGLCALRRLTRLIPTLAHVLASELKVLQSLTQFTLLLVYIISDSFQRFFCRN